MQIANKQLFDLKKKIETATPQQMALLQKKAEDQKKSTILAEKPNWWKKRTQLEKNLLIGGSVLAIGVAIYFIRKRKK
jgi:hypothetical protein